MSACAEYEALLHQLVSKSVAALRPLSEVAVSLIPQQGQSASSDGKRRLFSIDSYDPLRSLQSESSATGGQNETQQRHKFLMVAGREILLPLSFSCSLHTLFSSIFQKDTVYIELLHKQSELVVSKCKEDIQLFSRPRPLSFVQKLLFSKPLFEEIDRLRSTAGR